MFSFSTLLLLMIYREQTDFRIIPPKIVNKTFKSNFLFFVFFFLFRFISVQNQKKNLLTIHYASH